MDRGGNRWAPPEIMLNFPTWTTFGIQRKRYLHTTSTWTTQACPFLDAAVYHQPQFTGRDLGLARMTINSFHEKVEFQKTEAAQY